MKIFDICVLCLSFWDYDTCVNMFKVCVRSFHVQRPSLPPAVAWTAEPVASLRCLVVCHGRCCSCCHRLDFAILPQAFLRTQLALHFASMPRSSKLCLVCKNHYSMARRRCQLCLRYRALPSCRPEHCWIEAAKSCRECLVEILIRGGYYAARKILPVETLRAILSFLQEEDWW